MTGLDLTPNEERLYHVLSDGQYHRVEELMSCLDDELATREALYSALYRLRNKMANGPYYIIFRKVDGDKCYRLMGRVSRGE